MSSPAEHQPFASPDPWHDQQSAPVQPQSNLPPHGYRQPSPPVPKQGNGLAIAAIEIAVVALMMGLGGFVSQIFMGAIFGGLASSGNGYAPSASSMPGTAPQVVAGQSCPGTQLQDEVGRVIRTDGGNVKSVSCPPTPAVVAGAVTVCQAVVDGSNWNFRITFEDLLGHFTLEQKLS